MGQRIELARYFNSFLMTAVITALGFSLFTTSALAENTSSSPTDPTMPYLDSSFSCITSDQAQKFIADFRIDIQSFGGIELCDNSKDSKKLFNDLGLIQNGHFSDQGSHLLVKNFIPSNQYYQWMKSQTRGMERGNDVPYATAYNRGGYFTMQDGWAESSTLGRVGTVLHEARHTAGYRHIPCLQGPYQGVNLDACDRDYSYGGSHALEMEYYARVSVQGQNFHPVYKTMARLMAIARSNFVFNKLPIQKREGVLAIDERTQSATLLVDGQTYQREIPANFQGTLKRTSFGASFWQGLKTAAIELYETSGSRPLLEDGYSYLKLLVRETGNIQDIEEMDLGTKRYFIKIQNNQIYNFNFPQGDWSNPENLPTNLALSATVLPQGQRGYFIINQQGQVYQYNPQQKQFSLMNQIQWNFEDQQMAVIDNQVLILKKNGQIYMRNDQRQEQPYPALNSTYLGLVNVPLYDGFTIAP